MNTLERYLEEYKTYDIGYHVQKAAVVGALVTRYETEINLFHDRYPDKYLTIDTFSLELQGGNREMLTHFLQCFGGTWKKELEDYYPDKIKYVQEVEHPVYKVSKLCISARQAEPPPSCQIVEVEEDVPAHKRKVKKIVCPQTEEIITPMEEVLI